MREFQKFCQSLRDLHRPFPGGEAPSKMKSQNTQALPEFLRLPQVIPTSMPIRIPIKIPNWEPGPSTRHVSLCDSLIDDQYFVLFDGFSGKIVRKKRAPPEPPHRFRLRRYGYGRTDVRRTSVRPSDVRRTSVGRPDGRPSDV